MMEQKFTFDQFCEIIKTLRGEHGCPWDKIQTHESLIPCMIEEAYEAVEGIKILEKKGEPDNLCEELGDVMMQVVFHSQLAEEEGFFTLEDVVDGISRKMIHRHPHVFGDHPKEKPDWEALKKEEHGNMTPQEDIAAVPRALPALIRTSKVLKKMDKYYGCERDADASMEKARCRLESIRQDAEVPEIEEKVGEAFLYLCNYARLKGINSELLLEKTLEKHLKNHEIQ